MSKKRRFKKDLKRIEDIVVEGLVEASRMYGGSFDKNTSELEIRNLKQTFIFSKNGDGNVYIKNVIQTLYPKVETEYLDKVIRNNLAFSIKKLPIKFSHPLKYYKGTLEVKEINPNDGFIIYNLKNKIYNYSIGPAKKRIKDSVINFVVKQNLLFSYEDQLNLLDKARKITNKLVCR